jgi:hypothetical protein
MNQLISILFDKTEPHVLNTFLVQIINLLGYVFFVIAADALENSSNF